MTSVVSDGPSVSFYQDEAIALDSDKGKYCSENGS